MSQRKELASISIFPAPSSLNSNKATPVNPNKENDSENLRNQKVSDAVKMSFQLENKREQGVSVSSIQGMIEPTLLKRTKPEQSKESIPQDNTRIKKASKGPIKDPQRKAGAN
eukprot:TRINITY_DN1745_c0_g2_i1.p1 TRINITY_DN1745_c0_g2~~TRINITY_DN1745_c0_g2_i1.p1  ORF type:complete len:113 (+),score=22.12 TRINITY_DN1745_c0_g2_i1:270-608(+)